MKKNSKKRALSLLEVMIVIVIISLVAGVTGFKMRESLEKGKAFKTEMAIQKLYEVLTLEDIHPELFPNKSALEDALRESAFTRDPKVLLQDGWGEEFQFVSRSDGEREFYSKRFVEYRTRKGEADYTYPWDREANPVRNYPWENQQGSNE